MRALTLAELRAGGGGPIIGYAIGAGGGGVSGAVGQLAMGAGPQTQTPVRPSGNSWNHGGRGGQRRSNAPQHNRPTGPRPELKTRDPYSPPDPVGNQDAHMSLPQPDLFRRPAPWTPPEGFVGNGDEPTEKQKYEWLRENMARDGLHPFEWPLEHRLGGKKPTGREAPKDAHDPNGSKAPRKPGKREGFEDPAGGEQWVPNPNDKSPNPDWGWFDKDGSVWVPTGPKPSIAHGGPHWDKQNPKTGGHENKHLGGHTR